MSKKTKLMDEWKNERWKNYELQNNDIDMFQTYHNTERQWKNLSYYKRYLPKYFSEDERFCWIFEISEKLRLPQIEFCMYRKIVSIVKLKKVPTKTIFTSCTHTKYKKIT